MALKTTVRMGGASGATTVDYTSVIPIWTLNEQGEHQSIFDVGMKCDNGNASQFQFTLDNDLGDIPRADLTRNLPAFTRVTVTDDAPGWECVLAYGRIARKDVGRGDKDYGDARQFRVTVNDANFDLTDLDLAAPWVRGSESGRARVLAALSAFANGSPRLTTVLATHLVAAGGEVTMPAKTYAAGSTLIEIFNDCATVEGKIYAVVIHHVASVSHLCFLYIDESDHTTFASTLSISDSLAEINNTTVFAPMWDQGPASLEDGDVDPISHLVSTYGADSSDYVVAANVARVTSYDYRARGYNDSKSVTAAQATTRAAAILSAKGSEHVSHQVTIQLRASMVDKLSAGMSINIKSAASMGGQYLGTTQTRRIAELKWEPIGPASGAEVGFYLAHMQLDRAVRILGEGKGTAPIFNAPCEDFGPVASLGANATGDGANYNKTVVTGPRVERVQLTLTQSVAAGQSIVVIAGHTHNADPAWAVYDSGGNTYTQAAEHRKTISGDQPRVGIWYSNITTALSAGSVIGFEVDVGSSLLATSETDSRAISAYLFSGSLSAGTESGTGSGFDAAPAVTVGAGGLIVAGLINKGGASGFPDTITNDADWTAFTQTYSDTEEAFVQLAGGFRVADADGETWSGTIDQSRDWAMVGATFTAAPCVPDTQATGSTSTEGDSTAAARADHVHAHGTYASGDLHTNYVQETLIDAKGDLLAGTAADTVARLAVGTNDYILTADSTASTGIKWAVAPSGSGIPATIVDAKGDIIAATAADTVARLAVGTNDQVLTADSTASTGVKWATSAASISTPWALVPDTGIVPQGSALDLGAANRGILVPAYLVTAATITGIRVRIGASAGNVSVAIYDSSLARLATSGSVAAPAAGGQTVAFTGNYSAAAGRYYIGISASSISCTFTLSQGNTIFGPLAGIFMETAHPLPATFVSAGGSRAVACVGIISGGLAG